ncbi:MAG TPA: response regulator [Blastocatellia bacterium]|nr:response regulator [Blastocatellia bacterium]
MSKQPHTILIVDDEPANIRLLERLLRPVFGVVKASNGPEALGILRSQKVSMLITDQRMPGMTGVELLRESIAINPDMVRMMITGDSANSTFIEAIKNGGAIRVVHKPWDPDKLMQIIVASLEKYDVVLATKQSINRLKQANERLKKVTERA